MLVACRLAGLSALKTYCAGVGVGAQLGPRGFSLKVMNHNHQKNATDANPSGPQGSLRGDGRRASVAEVRGSRRLRPRANGATVESFRERSTRVGRFHRTLP